MAHVKLNLFSFFKPIIYINVEALQVIPAVLHFIASSSQPTNPNPPSPKKKKERARLLPLNHEADKGPLGENLSRVKESWRDSFLE